MLKTLSKSISTSDSADWQIGEKFPKFKQKRIKQKASLSDGHLLCTARLAYRISSFRPPGASGSGSSHCGRTLRSGTFSFRLLPANLEIQNRRIHVDLSIFASPVVAASWSLAFGPVQTSPTVRSEWIGKGEQLSLSSLNLAERSDDHFHCLAAKSPINTAISSVTVAQ